MSLDIKLSSKFFTEDNKDIQLDNLTNVYNRETITKYINYLVENKKTFYFAIIDIDNFKHINDGYGHLVGDDVLVNMASIYKRLFKGTGIIGRYGGDEFMAVFEDIDGAQAWELFHCLNSFLNTNPVSKSINFTLSVTTGLANYPNDASNYESLFECADKALYRGKEKGRNCFIIYDKAKHGNIKANNAAKNANCKAIAINSINYIEQAAKNHNISNLLYYLQSTFNFDHICIQVDNKVYFEILGRFAKDVDFGVIDVDLIKPMISSDGLNIGNYNMLLFLKKTEMYNMFDSHNIHSAMYFEIKAYEHVYGLLRIEMLGGRIWQDNEILLFTWISRGIGLILENKNLKISDLK